MNAQCSHCNTVFRVDPAKVPQGGARVRCSVCRGVFEVRPAAAAASAASTSRPTAPAPAQPAQHSVPTPSPAQPAQSAPAPSRPAPSFGSNDPSAKARRLARALVSDIVTYHPERRDKALADGTLKREFMDEIKKSWEEYVQQVGATVARSTPHFRDALNDILARGQSLF